MMNRWLFFLLFTLSTNVAAQHLNTTLIGNINYGKHISDVWGYIDTSGNDYAIVGLGDGVSVVKVEADTIYEVDSVNGVGSLWRDIKTHGNYAYITNESGSGLMIIDLSQLPNSIQLVKNDATIFTTAHNLHISNGHVFLAGSNRSGGSDFLDLADPENPVLAGQSAISYYHDVFVQNEILYASTGGRGSVAIFDISTKGSPQQIGEIFIPSSGYSHNAWATADGNYIMTTEETTNKTVKMWDITDLSNPELVDEYLAAGRLAHNAHIKGDYAYVSHYSDGVRILDIADPTNMVEMGYYDTFLRNGSGFDGCWGAFPFTNSGYIYATDQSTGLHVFEFNGKKASRIYGWVFDSQSGESIGEATIELATGEISQSNLRGQFKLGFVEPGSYTALFYKAGYDTAEVTVTLAEGDNIFEQVFLNPDTPTGIANNSAPETFALLQNYPNPFNAGTTIRYTIAEQTEVRLKIYDLLGHEIAKLVDGVQPQGEYRLNWSGQDSNGKMVASGIYFYELQTENFKQVNRMMFVQ